MLTLYHKARSAKIILSFRTPTEGKDVIRTAVFESKNLGAFACAAGDEAARLVASCGSGIVLQDGEGLGCMYLVNSPTFGTTASGIGIAIDHHLPFKDVSTSDPTFFFVASEASIKAMFGGLADYLSACRNIHSQPLDPWPTTYNSDEMARLRATAEANHTEALNFQSITMSQTHQKECDRKIMALCEVNFRHCAGVRQFYLDQPDYKDPSKKWWYGAWVVEYLMEALAEMHKDAAMNQGEAGRLTTELTPLKRKFTCAGCMGKVELQFNGDITLDGDNHSGCTGPLANKLQETVTASMKGTGAAAADDGAVVGPGGQGGARRGRRGPRVNEGTLTDVGEAIRQALFSTPFSKLSLPAAMAMRLCASATNGGPTAISNDDVDTELKRIGRLTEDQRTSQEAEIYGVWVEGGAKLKLLKSWTDKENQITAYHDSTNLRTLLIIRVHGPSLRGEIEPYAHAVLVPDAGTGTGTFKDRATRVYSGLSLIDDNLPRDGYKLTLGDERVRIGCVGINFEQAGDTKGGHRVCLAKSTKGLKDAIAADNRPPPETEQRQKRQRLENRSDEGETG